MILQEEFPNVPHSYIKKQLTDKKSLYLTYLNLAESEGSFGSVASRLYERLKNPRKSKLFPADQEGNNVVERDYRGYGPEELTRELVAARAARKKEEGESLGYVLSLDRVLTIV